MKKLNTVSLILFKAFLSFCLAYVLSFIGKELISYGSFSFVFIFISVYFGFFYFLKPYKFKGVFMVSLILIGIAFFLRFYVIMAYSTN
ncbi:MAG: hypothetical protein GDA46_02545 [Bdellovibrionales bacterium]|nr:hypothetical protein [Bdellovibrionales bacterium]